jgi:alpha-tubulin suppressor-like RCC1 family protein
MARLGRGYHAISVAGSQGSGGFTCGIRLDRQIECWGRNSRGAAGYADPSTGIPPDFITTPNILPGLANCTDIATASSNACAICDGGLSCWGDHRRGAVGSGPITTAAITAPRNVDLTLSTGESWAQVVLGGGYGCARTTEGRGYCWGLSTRGALGTGAASANLPITVQLAP